MSDNRGRPRTFQLDQALEKALDPFWRAGYFAASYPDICAATGLTKPSLYAAFGNKENLFLAVLDFYSRRFVQPGIEILEAESDPREAIFQLLVATADALTAEGTPPGCMIVTNGSCASAPNVPIAIVDALRAAAKQTPNAIAGRLAEIPVEQLPQGTDASALAAYFDMMITGLSGLAKRGATRQDLILAIDTAMLIWKKNDAE